MFAEAVGYFSIVLLTETNGIRKIKRWIDQKRIKWSSLNKIILENDNNCEVRDEDVMMEAGKVEGLINRSNDDDDSNNEILNFSYRFLFLT